MMANKREIIIILGVTILLLGILGVWLGSKKGDFALMGSNNYTVDEETEVPLAPRETDEETTNTNEDLIQVTDMETQNIILQTSRGAITIELFTGAMPITTGNFLDLVRDDFYDGTKFHRVIEGFMIQGGDPNSKGDDTATYGQGGPGYTIEDEFVEGDLLTNTRGTLAMANTGQPNSGGSQFFINLEDNTFLDFNKEPLTSKHPVFGRVVDGMDLIDEIATVETLPRDVPIEPIVIEDIEVVPETDGSTDGES